MIKIHALIASALGIGYVGKGDGTIAGMVFCIIWFLLPAGFHQSNRQVLLTLLTVIIGTSSSCEVYLN